VLELYVEDLPSVDVAGMTLPWPVFHGTPEPDPTLEPQPQQETVPMPAALFDQLAASSLDAGWPSPSPMPALVPASASAPAPAPDAQALAGADDSVLEGAPFVFELLRRAAHVSAPPQLPQPERTRADDLLDRFTAGGSTDEQSLRAAASSLKSFIGLDATPMPAMRFTPQPLPAARADAPVVPGARPSAPPAFIVPKLSARRGLAAFVPLLCFVLGMLAAMAVVSAIRPELISAVGHRLSGTPAAAPPAAEKAAPPADAQRRTAPRAERDDKPAGRPRTAN
jgi:hypothetical protein